jgi:hypothetical protein
MYNSEMAPPQLRGRLSQLFQVILTFAIFAAQVCFLVTIQAKGVTANVLLALQFLPRRFLVLIPNISGDVLCPFFLHMISDSWIKQHCEDVAVLQVINIGTEKLYPWGWRLSLGLAAVPATTLLLGGIILDDTPNSLLERGHPEKVCSPPAIQLKHAYSHLKTDFWARAHFSCEPVTGEARAGENQRHH